MTPQRRVRIDVLGPLRFQLGDQDANLPTGRPRQLLEAVLSDLARRRSADVVAATIWPGVERQTGRRRIQQVATRLRRSLPDGAELTLVDGTFELHVATDIDDFLQLADAAGPGADGAIQRALDIWRGPAFEDFTSTPAVRHARRRLHAIRDRLAEARRLTDRAPAATHTPAAFRAVAHDAEIIRPRLLATLPTVGRRRLVSLVAPGGSGKSTLLRQWIDSSEAAACWIDLTPEHNSVSAFMSAVHAAVRTMPTGGRLTDPLLSGPANLNWVINELVDHPGPTAIVLDGVEHLLHERPQAALADLVRLVPPHVTVGIATRRQLPNSISRSAASGDSMTLGPNELALTIEELGEIAERFAQPHRPGLLAEIHRQTGGWPEAAIAVLAGASATLAVSDRNAIHRSDDAHSNATDVLRHLPDEFLERILRDVERADQAWLVAVAHLDVLDFDLAEAVTGTPTRPHVARLSVDHCLLGVVDGRAVPRPPLGYLLAQRQWEQPSAARQAHARASAWWLANDRPSTALDHALASTDPTLISTAAPSALPAAVAAADVACLRRWLPALASHVELTPQAQLTARVGSALCASDARRAQRRLLGADAAALAVDDVIELWSDARCRAALNHVAQARALVDRSPHDGDPTLTAFLDTAERECEILLEDSTPSASCAKWLRDTESTPVAWLRVWSYGLLALGAHLAGDRPAATVLLDRAESDATHVHSSGRDAVGAFALLTRTLIEAESAGGSPLATSIAELERATERADRDGREALSIALRYAASRVRRRGGDGDDADRMLADADARLSARSDLALLSKLRHHCVAGGAIHDPRDDLTPRERIVLEQLDSDLTLADVAAVLFTSTHTVRAQVRSIYRKLGVSRRAEAVAILRGARSSET